MRIDDHPILTFKNGRRISFMFDGKQLYGFVGDTIAAALHANGVKVLGRSSVHGRPRGFYCAIGNCGSCNMVVNGVPNIRTCVTPLEKGMVVETQVGKGHLK